MGETLLREAWGRDSEEALSEGVRVGCVGSEAGHPSLAPASHCRGPSVPAHITASGSWVLGQGSFPYSNSWPMGSLKREKKTPNPNI